MASRGDWTVRASSTALRNSGSDCFVIVVVRLLLLLPGLGLALQQAPSEDASTLRLALVDTAHGFLDNAAHLDVSAVRRAVRQGLYAHGHHDAREFLRDVLHLLVEDAEVGPLLASLCIMGTTTVFRAACLHNECTRVDVTSAAVVGFRAAQSTSMADLALRFQEEPEPGAANRVVCHVHHQDVGAVLTTTTHSMPLFLFVEVDKAEGVEVARSPLLQFAGQTYVLIAEVVHHGAHYTIVYEARPRLLLHFNDGDVSAYTNSRELAAQVSLCLFQKVDNDVAVPVFPPSPPLWNPQV